MLYFKRVCFVSTLSSLVLLGEDKHKHHHIHPTLARRPGPDLPYHLFLRPLFWAVPPSAPPSSAVVTTSYILFLVNFADRFVHEHFHAVVDGMDDEGDAAESDESWEEFEGRRF